MEKYIKKIFFNLANGHLEVIKQIAKDILLLSRLLIHMDSFRFHLFYVINSIKLYFLVLLPQLP